MLAIRLPEEIEKRLERLAKQTGRTTLAKRSFNIWMTWKTSTSPKRSWKRSAPDKARPFRWKVMRLYGLEHRALEQCPQTTPEARQTYCQPNP
jgi:hypothetical protein